MKCTKCREPATCPLHSDYNGNYLRGMFNRPRIMNKKDEIERLHLIIEDTINILRDDDRDIFDCHDLAIRRLKDGESRNG